MFTAEINKQNDPCSSIVWGNGIKVFLLFFYLFFYEGFRGGKGGGRYCIAPTSVWSPIYKFLYN